MRPKPLIAVAPLLLIAVFAAIAGFSLPGGSPGVPVSAATVILVTSTADVEFPPDGGCTLRAAIEASNDDALAGNCDSGSGTDGIRFSIDPPVINITSELPMITDVVTIGNPSSKVELHGPGSLSYVSGLVLQGAGSSGSTVRNLVINGFDRGIYLNTTTNITIRGNYIGTNSAGTAAIGNASGIYLNNSSATIGGTAAGVGNLISGNDYGIYVEDSAPEVNGNLIGTNAGGTAAVPNTTAGIHLNLYNLQSLQFPFTIGGAAAGEGNVISGNTGDGIALISAETVSRCRETSLAHSQTAAARSLTVGLGYACIRPPTTTLLAGSIPERAISSPSTRSTASS